MLERKQREHAWDGEGALRSVLLACGLALVLCGVVVQLSAAPSSATSVTGAQVAPTAPLRASVSAASLPATAVKENIVLRSAKVAAALHASREARGVREAVAAAAATRRVQQAMLRPAWPYPNGHNMQPPRFGYGYLPRSHAADPKLWRGAAAFVRGPQEINLTELVAPDKWRAASQLSDALTNPAWPQSSSSRHVQAPGGEAARAAGLSAHAVQLLLNDSYRPRPAALQLQRRLAHCLTLLSKVRTLRKGPRFAAASSARGMPAPPRPVAAQLAKEQPPEQMLSCAVVGSSDTLRLHALASGGRLGALIDRHDVVLRINHAPTRGYERAVGNKTTYRLVNHVLLDAWLLPAESRPAEFATDLCSGAGRDVHAGCLYRERGTARLQVLAEYSKRHGAASVTKMGAHMMALEDACARALPRAPMSGGFLGILLAAQARCALPVDVYGFFPFCCHAQPFPDLNYKYYLDSSTRWVCCASDREAMEEEYALFEELQRLGWLRLHAMPPHGQIGSKCSSLTPEAALEHRFEQHANVATSLSDFGCGELSLVPSLCVCRVCVARAARTCLALNGTCVGYEVSQGSPHLATLKGSLGALSAKPGVTLYVLKAAVGSGARAQPSFRMSVHMNVKEHDMPCDPSVRSLMPSTAATSCVVCPGVAARLCERAAGCAGYAVNKEGVLATLKTGFPLPLVRAHGATAFTKEQATVIGALPNAAGHNR